ncbi:MAG: chaperone modulator CbpM [Burkholderiales bacterium]
MRDEDILVGYVMSDAGFTLEEGATLCTVDAAWLQHRLEEGFIPQAEMAGGRWRLSTEGLARARRMRRIERDFEAGPEIAALVADLLEEVESLRSRLRRAGLE